MVEAVWEVMMESTKLEYVVYRLNWLGHHDQRVMRLPGEKRVASFATEWGAATDCRRREAEVRERIGNPFSCGSEFHYLSTFPIGVYCDWLRDNDIEPPETDNLTLMAEWWQRTSKRLTALQRARVWEGLDKVRFFEVRAVDPAKIGYAVVAVQWNYNDTWYDAKTDGGCTVKVFRSREAAERFRISREREMQHIASSQGGSTSDFRRHSLSDNWPFRGKEEFTWNEHPDHVFYELVEVALV